MSLYMAVDNLRPFLLLFSVSVCVLFLCVMFVCLFVCLFVFEGWGLGWGGGGPGRVVARGRNVKHQ